LDQSFNLQQLQKLYKDIELNFLGINEEELIAQLNDIGFQIKNSSFIFDFITNNNTVSLKNSDLAQKIILRKLNDNIKRIYKDEQANRRIIISQIKILLEEGCPFYVLKTDIKSFYDSIDRDRIIRRLKEDAMLSYHSLFLLKQIFAHPIISSNTGLPRGVNISSTLSEYYMRKFDRWARQFPGVYFYARFVDDIIIFTNSNKSALQFETLIDKKLEELAIGLKKNIEKTQIYEGLNISKELPLNYLGYKFYRNSQIFNQKKTVREEKHITKLTYKIDGANALITLNDTLSLVSYTTEEEKIKKKQLQVGIADNKISKIKTRIVKSFAEYCITGDFLLLENRIKFLTGNYPIRKSIEKKELRAGVFYNYVEIVSYDDLIALDTFYRKIIFSKKRSLGVKINLKLTQVAKMKLKKYSFVSGFTKKIYHPFTPTDMNLIVEGW